MCPHCNRTLLFVLDFRGHFDLCCSTMWHKRGELKTECIPCSMVSVGLSMQFQRRCDTIRSALNAHRAPRTRRYRVLVRCDACLRTMYRRHFSSAFPLYSKHPFPTAVLVRSALNVPISRSRMPRLLRRACFRLLCKCEDLSRPFGHKRALFQSRSPPSSTAAWIRCTAPPR